MKSRADFLREKEGIGQQADTPDCAVRKKEGKEAVVRGDEYLRVGGGGENAPLDSGRECPLSSDRHRDHSDQNSGQGDD
jgi:hypothetical protein